MKIGKNISEAFVEVTPYDLSREELDSFIDFLEDFTAYTYDGFQDFKVFCRDDIETVLNDLLNLNSHLAKEVLSCEDEDARMLWAKTASKLLSFCGPSDSYIFVQVGD